MGARDNGSFERRAESLFDLGFLSELDFAEAIWNYWAILPINDG